MPFRIRVRLALSLFLFCLAAWAGREFPAQPGEQTKDLELLVKIKLGALSSVILNRIPGATLQALSPFNIFRVKLPAGASSGVSSLLANDSSVEFVEPNRVRRATIQTPNDVQFSSQWSLTTVQALQAWNLLPNRYLVAGTATTSRVKVAVIDTGVDCTHPDFVNAGGTSTDSAQGGQLLFSASQALVPTTVSPAVCPWQDDYGHGTHVAGIVAAATQNGLGIASLGYPLQVVVYKVLDVNGTGDDATIANAIIAAADAGVQVISMSLGGAGYSQTIQSAINYAWQHNVVIVAAAGNSANSSLIYPAGANFTVGVAATNTQNQASSYSNYGSYVDIAAPGDNILSTVPTYLSRIGVMNYAALSGTSMATPHVSALAGLLAMSTPNVAAAAIIERIQQTAVSQIVNGGWDQHVGYGIVNAYNALAGNLRSATVGGLVGQVTDTIGMPVALAQLTMNGQTVVADAYGLYRFAAVPPGTYGISVTATGFPTQNLSATIVAGADATLPVKMGVSYASFSGTITSGGRPVAGAAVLALSGALIAATAFSDANGQYRIWVPVGTAGGIFDIRASAVFSNVVTIAGQSVAPGGAAAVNMVLPQFGTVSGTVRNGAGQTVAGASIAVSNATVSAGAISDANGNYAVAGLPSGAYSVDASYSGFQDVIVNNAAVSANTNTVMNLQFGQTTQASELVVYGTGVASPSSLGNSAAQVSIVQTGFSRNRATGIWSSTVSVTNLSGSTMPGPIALVVRNLTAGVTMTNAAGWFNGDPFITIPGITALNPGQSASISIQFTNPANGFINAHP